MKVRQVYLSGKKKKKKKNKGRGQPLSTKEFSNAGLILRKELSVKYDPIWNNVIKFHLP